MVDFDTMSADGELQACQARVAQLRQAGAEREALAVCEQGLQRWPDDVELLVQAARLALRARAFALACAWLERAAARQPEQPALWLQLAMARRASRNVDGELAALQQALTLNPYDLMALLMRGDCLLQAGRRPEAAQAYRAALTVAEQMPAQERIGELNRLLTHAQGVVDQQAVAQGKFLDEAMAEAARELQPGAELDRFQHALDLLLGRRKRFDSQPIGLFYPRLAPREFFPRTCFPWASELEAQTDVIRNEFLAVHAADHGFEPYLQYGDDAPLQQWTELNRNPRWSAFHLLKEGRPVEANAARCPQTLAALRSVPQPLQSGRTPVAMFSCLRPRTHIPPHVGVSNVRLVAHLPLIIPADCGIRVGSEIHAWEPGRICVFDDTVEHEAWNRSDQLRVVFIFDVWHPDLSADERRMIGALAQAQDAFVRSQGGYASAIGEGWSA
jgi:aspartyl/asparaginyl beta-hydroxylase (cupin superfamily)